MNFGVASSISNQELSNFVMNSPEYDLSLRNHIPWLRWYFTVFIVKPSHNMVHTRSELE